MLNALKEIRRGKNLTQAGLAERCGPGWDGRRISELETRPLPARVHRLQVVARALGVNIDDLVGRLEEHRQ